MAAGIPLLPLVALSWDKLQSLCYREYLMVQKMKDLGIDQMSLEDRLALVQEIWDSIAADAEQLPLTEAQRRELERRLAAHAADPSKVIPWEEVKAQALARAKR
jgi:putative addiction module component (TIGR02574 family)